ncbi:MAG: hypothetical protein P1V20_12155 [Verrucomicrobiales bacterium]|nr:hypothetical protein [Verrucomicrobiales bacterium]
MKSFFSIIFCVIVGSSSVCHAETSSANNSKVKEFYNNFPGSDANNDGVLTVSEMRSFIVKKVRSSATSKNYPPLNRVLKKDPKSDLNGDGVLTKTELIKYLN